jgi:hypothetical protein
LFQPADHGVGNNATRNRFKPKGKGPEHREGNEAMNSIIYLVGLVVVVLAILSLFGLR